MKNPHLVWAGVVCVFMIVGGSILLAMNDKDPEVIKDTIVNAAIPLLAVFGVGLWQKVGKVEDLTNGDRTRMNNIIKEKDEKIEEQARQLQEMALRLLPPPDNKGY